MDTYCPYHNRPCKEIHEGQIPHADIFFAYPSQPETRIETIEAAIQKFRDSHGSEAAIDWTELAIEGRVIFCAICEAIRNSSCVVADISGAEL